MLMALILSLVLEEAVITTRCGRRHFVKHLQHCDTFRFFDVGHVGANNVGPIAVKNVGSNNVDNGRACVCRTCLAPCNGFLGILRDSLKRKQCRKNSKDVGERRNNSTVRYGGSGGQLWVPLQRKRMMTMLRRDLRRPWREGPRSSQGTSFGT